MRGYPVRLVPVVDCGCSAKSLQMRWLVQHFLGALVQKAYFQLSTYFWVFSKDPGKPVQICAFSPEPSLNVWRYINHVWNCPDVLCASENGKRSAKAAQIFVHIWKCCPWSMSHFVRYTYLSHVYTVLVQTSLRICAVLQEHLLLAHSVLIAYAHTRYHF